MNSLAAGQPPAETASIMDAIMEFRRLSGFLLAALTGATIGYFAGREHLKYEMRAAIQSAAEQVKHELSSAFGKPASTSTQPRPGEAPTPKPTTEPTPISVALLKKGFHDKNIMASDYQDTITFAVSFSNRTGKDIRAFDGVLAFTDLLDNQILNAKVEINQPVSAGSTLKWDGQLDYNQFMSAHQRLRTEDQSNLKLAFTVRKVLFSDGTVRQYGE
jgi:hypothetical protein